MPSSPADTFAVIVALTDKLVADQPRNLDLARLRFLLNVRKAEQPRKRDWAAQKRRQRARRRQLAVTAARESVKDTP